LPYSRDAEGDILSDINEQSTVRNTEQEAIMSNGEQVQAKKGLPVWAWIGIGCGALLIMVLVVVMVGGFFVARKVQDVAADFEENPAMATAKMIVKLNPELEEVNFEDIEEGKLSFTTDEGEVTIDASELEDSGSLTVTNEEGKVVLATGAAASEDIESWVPVYPGSEPANRHSMRTEEEMSGGFELETSASVAEALEFYRNALEAEGYEVAVNTFTQDDSEGGMVNGSHADEGRNVVAIFNSEGGGPTKIVVSYSRK
jgi:uncharacterized protein YneF (UPF0154 family)